MNIRVFQTNRTQKTYLSIYIYRYVDIHKSQDFQVNVADRKHRRANGLVLV